MLEHVVQLKCGVKHDPWGKVGKDSLAGQLWSQTPGSSAVKDGEHYSEMWMGTYPTVPSRLLCTGETLEHYLKRNPELLGKSVTARFGRTLPFLPKVLSFDKALPLQVHPDKRLAEQLNLKDPDSFGDANHKPEIAVALSEFELFAGFKPLKDIEALVKLQPLEQFVPPHTNFDDELLREICKNLLKLEPGVVSETVKQLIALPAAAFGHQENVPGLLERLSKQYSESDNGTLVAVLLMNYMVLQPGEAVCVPADSIHAYLNGDILECMARSDNVLATGFCPRADRNSIDLFAKALSFKPHNHGEASLGSKSTDKSENGKTVEYAPPFSEFNVLATRLEAGEEERHKPIRGPSILVVTKGSGELVVVGEKKIDLHEGAVFFIADGVPLEFLTQTGVEVYRPYAE
ncbi:RmlC-like cupin domain-containing protein [Aspergillus karnatakaensis]|uniref:RmlC-like cupin domain-containing protein n=1 Tax=Aspergillus karnatakaensis TaxID=1810916 RepID=UPI003CCDB9AE